MISKSKVSVVLVVHEKYKKYLRTALTSLKRQTIRPEVIIVNNGKSRRISWLLKLYPWVKEVKCTKNLAGASNEGIRQASGEYIIRIDADDFIDPILIEAERDFLENHPDIHCIYCDYWESHKTNEGEGFEVYHLNHSPQETLEHACGAMYRKECWEALGGYDESLNYQEGYDFWARFTKLYKAERLIEPMYFYRKHSGSMSTDQERLKVRAELEAKYL